MKEFRFLLLFVAVTLSVSDSFAEARFFKANSVRLKYVWFDAAVLDSNTESLDYRFAEMWTGNDTIVDGYSCVTLWDQNEGEDPVLIGCLREDENGYVWRYYWNYSKFADAGNGESAHLLERLGIINDWAFLYDFSNPNWEEGTTIEIGDRKDPKAHVTSKINAPSTITAKNGETIPTTRYGFLIYGIGILNPPFECEPVGHNLLWNAAVLEYWRDGELLLKNYMIPEQVKSATNILTASMSTSSEAKSYDLTGRPADGTQKGIYIKDGKKVVVR